MTVVTNIDHKVRIIRSNQGSSTVFVDEQSPVFEAAPSLWPRGRRAFVRIVGMDAVSEGEVALIARQARLRDRKRHAG